ncbi:MAG: hypothetical protein KQA40_00975 [Candidatus Aenigmarchaeota archaeon]|nr:hypothetical protein [Candidatus Aenigmarchaeota archaeon]
MEIIKTIIIALILMIILLAVGILFGQQIISGFSQVLKIGEKESQPKAEKFTTEISSLGITEDTNIYDKLKIFIENFNLDYKHETSHEDRWGTCFDGSCHISYYIYDYSSYPFNFSFKDNIYLVDLLRTARESEKVWFKKINNKDANEISECYISNCDLSINENDFRKNDIIVKVQDSPYNNNFFLLYVKIIYIEEDDWNNVYNTYKPVFIICRGE